MKNSKTETYYIGLSATYHDTALAVVDSQGKIVFAEATERYMQSKRGVNCYPDNTHIVQKVIKDYCAPDSQFVIARTWSQQMHDFLKTEFLSGSINFVKTESLHEEMLKYVTFDGYGDAWLFSLKLLNMLNLSGQNLISFLHSEYRNSNVRTVDYSHHLTHAATACYTSPFDEGACMIVDGYGEFGATSYYHYKEGKITLVKELKGAESLGVIYSTCTRFCGFDPDKGEEWKVMGLAPYGKLDIELYEAFKKLIDVNDCSIKYSSPQNLNDWIALWISKMLPNDASPYEAADLAYTTQYVYSEIMSELLNNFYKLNLSDNLILSGGCALNSSFNGQITESTPFKRLYVPSAPGDDGNAIGAALLAYYADHPQRTKLRRPTTQTPYLGSTLSNKRLNHLIKFSKIEKIRHLPNTIHEETASLLTQGKLVGWVQGRAEFGPRALGNRSILADPRSKDMKEKINLRVKFREEFRPFAPSILHEFGEEFFENYQESPYMERTLKFRDSVLDKVPAVVHCNYTGRLQTVKQEWNKQYYQLIKTFYDITGIPLLLNTSFNVMGKPIMHTVEDAVSVFYTTGLDALVIGNYLIEK